MAAYKDLVGQKITKVTSNPGEPKTGQMWYNSTDGKLRGLGILEAWSSATDALYPSYNTTGFGAQTGSVFVGGSYPGYVNLTQEYNGSGFSTGGNYPESRGSIGTAGVLTAGLAWGGNSAPEFESQLTNEYNGTSWTNVNNYPITVAAPAGAGTQTAGLGAGGWDYSGPFSAKNTTNEYDGTNWTGGGNLNTARSSFWGGGTQTAAIMAGGDTFSPGTVSDYSAATEEYDGTSWTSVNSLPGTSSGIGGRTTNAVQTDFRIFSSSHGTAFTSPYVKNYAYDGTNWAAGPNFTTARYGAAGSGTGPAAVMTGGRTPSYVLTTEEFNKSTNAVTAAAWASSNNLNTGRNAGAGFGIQTAAVMTTGNEPGETNKTEHYDGTSWTNATNYPISKRFTAASGTLTSGLVAGGSPNVATVNKYDGTNWTAANSIPTATNGGVMFGTQTASVYSVGRNPSATTNTYEFDGTNWTAGGAAGTGRYFLASSGTLTAGLMFGGQTSGPTTRSETEEYDGTSWSESGDLGTGRYGVGGSSAGTQTDTIAFAGNNPAVVLTEGYDGTSWSTRPNMATARRFISGAGTATAGLGFGGNPPNNSTEEFTGETETANIADFTTS